MNAQLPLIEMRKVSKRYGQVEALIDVDFWIDRHEVIGLLGDNGAGKSTLIKILSGIESIDSGGCYQDGQPVKIRSQSCSRKMGIETIYQDAALVGSASIMRNFFAARELTGPLGFLRMRGMNEIAMSVLQDTIRIVGINSPAALVEELSGGQQQAVAIARAVHFKSKILLLDEPTSALSVRETNEVLALVTHLKDEGISSVFVSHNLYHAYDVSDRFVILSHGRIIKHFRKEETSVKEMADLISRL